VREWESSGFVQVGTFSFLCRVELVEEWVIDHSESWRECQLGSGRRDTRQERRTNPITETCL